MLLLVDRESAHYIPATAPNFSAGFRELQGTVMNAMLDNSRRCMALMMARELDSRKTYYSAVVLG